MNLTAVNRDAFKTRPFQASNRHKRIIRAHLQKLSGLRSQLLLHSGWRRIRDYPSCVHQRQVIAECSARPYNGWLKGLSRSGGERAGKECPRTSGGLWDRLPGWVSLKKESVDCARGRSLEPAAGGPPPAAPWSYGLQRPGQFGHLQDPFRSRPGLPAVKPVYTGIKPYVLNNRKVHVKRKDLGHVPDAFFYGARSINHPPPRHMAGAGGGRQKAHESVSMTRAFACAVSPRSPNISPFPTRKLTSSTARKPSKSLTRF